MEKGNPIVSIKKHGRIQIKLKACLDARGITRNRLARSIHVRFEVVDRWYRNDLEKLDLDILARICFALDCDIDDLLQYVKEDE